MKLVTGACFGFTIILAKLSKELCSGHSLPWRLGLESHFGQVVFCTGTVPFNITLGSKSQKLCWDRPMKKYSVSTTPTAFVTLRSHIQIHSSRQSFSHCICRVTGIVECLPCHSLCIVHGVMVSPLNS